MVWSENIGFLLVKSCILVTKSGGMAAQMAIILLQMHAIRCRDSPRTGPVFLHAREPNALSKIDPEQKY